ncbi:MAG: TonB-dependent receptor [Alphaproteobacteria bacterium HGW-Alphaproteobacteria-16]|nr:MAG: TonB-dependent receptor [Alphaproteobacteria bacterium HGW-Alphaproteobacteria-16]
MNTKQVLLMGSMFAALSSAPAFAQDAPESAAASSDDEVIVTGLRGQPRTVISSPTPIDVIGGEEVEKLAGGMQMRDVISQLVPSFQSSTVGSSSFNSLSRPAGLRGLSGVHVLVLVNGKRRHNSSIIDYNSGATSVGGNPVDLDLIPASAIERIEVLRDGASAQYGSDAIAGVINIILKKDASGIATIQAGQRYGYDGSGSDGETIQASIYKGFAIGEGSLAISAEAKKSKATVRNSDVTSRLYDFLPGGALDPREDTADRRTYQGGLPEVEEIKLSQNFVMPVGNVEVYSDGTFGYREARVGQAGRLPRSNQNIIEIYPDGFTPFYTLAETDFQFTGGLRGQAAGFNVDLSSTYGRNYVKNGADNTLNASMGTASPTQFDTFSSAFDQWTNNLDLTRSVDFGGETSLQVSLGAEYRYESYVTKPLDEAAYLNGGYFYSSGSIAGTPAQVGAQGAIVVTPEDAADVSRNVWAGYIDLALDVSSRFLITGAGRFEHYDDSSGSVFSGKLAARYEVTDWLAFRGALSNGFRAPSLAQQAFALTSTSINFVNNAYIPVQSKVVRTGSPIALALGAKPLTPEKSMNYSLGFTLTPAPSLTISVDAYQIQLDDRITLTGLLAGAGVGNILAANGFSRDQSVRYFTNALDTRTRGFDVVAAYTLRTESMGQFRGTLGFNYNDTDITRIADNPAELAGLNLTLIDRRSQGWFTEGPATKLILGINWEIGDFGLNVRNTRYDSYTSVGTTAAGDQVFSAKWITDVEVSYDVARNLTLSAGAYNLFDVYADRSTASNTIGLSPFGAAPFGGYGGYYYGRATVRF